jgi:hypothetical protein
MKNWHGWIRGWGLAGAVLAGTVNGGWAQSSPVDPPQDPPGGGSPPGEVPGGEPGAGGFAGELFPPSLQLLEAFNWIGLSYIPPPDTIGHWEMSADLQNWIRLGETVTAPVGGFPLLLNVEAPPAGETRYFRFKVER